MQRVVELAAHHFDINTIACAIQRAVGEDIQAGVENFAFVEKILGDKNAAFSIFTQNV